MDNHTENTDLISVVVPVYKVEDYLDRCIESVMRQTYGNWELILVDDGSPDRCGAICDEWAGKDARIRVIHQANGGLSAARNAGIPLARGEWIAFLDSDDWWADTFLEEMLAAARGSRVDLVIGGWAFDYEKEEAGNREASKLPEPGLFSSRCILMKMAKPGGVVYVTAWNRLIRRSLWGDLTFPPGKLHEDEYTAHLLIDKVEHLFCLDRPLVHYYQRGSSITAISGNLKHWDGTEALIQRYRYYKEIGYPELLAPTLEGIKYHYFLCLRELDQKSPEGRRRLKGVVKQVAPLLKDKEAAGVISARERLGMRWPGLWTGIQKIKSWTGRH